ncbi:hypothetical protein NOC27_766 [Nitrosococcus oceani AFC27]|nr:hypothetical protein NOC27_766 [Nitrosococcus oceani AFC27]
MCYFNGTSISIYIDRVMRQTKMIKNSRGEKISYNVYSKRCLFSRYNINNFK